MNYQPISSSLRPQLHLGLIQWPHLPANPPQVGSGVEQRLGDQCLVLSAILSGTEAAGQATSRCSHLCHSRVPRENSARSMVYSSMIDILPSRKAPECGLGYLQPQPRSLLHGTGTLVLWLPSAGRWCHRCAPRPAHYDERRVVKSVAQLVVSDATHDLGDHYHDSYLSPRGETSVRRSRGRGGYFLFPRCSYAASTGQFQGPISL